VSLAHQPVTLGPKGWELAAAWRVAAPHCQAETVEAVSLVRQTVWLPPRFVHGTLAALRAAAGTAAAASSGTLPLLGYPIYQLAPPPLEVDAAALRGGAAAARATLYSPPLNLSYSRRGWRLLRRVQPAARAALAGAGAAPLSGGLPPGAWSLPLPLLERLGRAVPAAPGEAAERCWEAGKLRIPKGGAVRVLLADLSLLCEAADTAGWSPAETWTPTPRLDSYPQGCAPAP
jgi:hypothetical protein